jgi:hypothetical protein
VLPTVPLTNIKERDKTRVVQFVPTARLPLACVGATVMRQTASFVEPTSASGVRTRVALAANVVKAFAKSVRLIPWSTQPCPFAPCARRIFAVTARMSRLTVKGVGTLSVVLVLIVVLISAIVIGTLASSKRKQTLVHNTPTGEFQVTERLR